MRATCAPAVVRRAKVGIRDPAPPPRRLATAIRSTHVPASRPAAGLRPEADGPWVGRWVAAQRGGRARPGASRRSPKAMTWPITPPGSGRSKCPQWRSRRPVDLDGCVFRVAGQEQQLPARALQALDGDFLAQAGHHRGPTVGRRPVERPLGRHRRCRRPAWTGLALAAGVRRASNSRASTQKGPHPTHRQPQSAHPRPPDPGSAGPSPRPVGSVPAGGCHGRGQAPRR